LNDLHETFFRLLTAFEVRDSSLSLRMTCSFFRGETSDETRITFRGYAPANKHYRAGKALYLPSLVSSFMLGWYIGDAICPKFFGGWSRHDNLGLKIGISGFAAIFFSANQKSHYRKAANLYNNRFNSEKDIGFELRFGATPNGVGMMLGF
jgi:hypothetical protein